MKKYYLLLLMLCCGMGIHADNGSKLWLNATGKSTAKIVSKINSNTIKIAKSQLLNSNLEGNIELAVDKNLNNQDGYQITVGADHKIRVASATQQGVLYGVCRLVRDNQMGIAPHSVSSNPAYELRLLNHWDNLDGSIERGYAGKSIFWHANLKGKAYDERIAQYALANASVGINGSVLNNVNASPKMLNKEYIDSVQHIANILRPYGIRVYLSINFGSPKALGATSTADPLDKDVIAWWTDKVKYIYKLIPDFGGFLVKASSEGQPGPNDYGRTHADGANMLADALKPFGGIVMWRSFVYGANHKGEDRVKQAVSEFDNLDGKFHENVILQSKNGPLDFQPREPYAPIFDHMKNTPQMAEFQITQEYTGQSKHLVYLGTMWNEFFDYVNAKKLKGIAGVANVGDDVNFCGHPFSQSNWYAFGRLAWDPSLKSEDIAKEWLQQTFHKLADKENSKCCNELIDMMMTSREACVNYMMPLGLHHIFKFDHHYGPEPDGFIASYPLEWCPVYYHKADSLGIGFDRSSKGSNAVSQYREPFRSMYDDVNTCPDEYILWFHHLPWNYRMHNGNTLWKNLQLKYNEGVSQVEAEQELWQQCRNLVDTDIWNHVDHLLDVQLDNAREWRDKCLEYFGSFQKK